MLTSARHLLRSPMRAQAAGASKRTFSVLQADTGKLGTKFYHLSGYALVGLFPLAVLYSPSMISKPVDLILGVLIPVHGHVGLNYVVSDYVPQAARGAARTGILGMTAVTILGLLKLNVSGPGLSQSLKQMWKSKKAE